jgi:hypothetical protein
MPYQFGHFIKMIYWFNRNSINTLCLFLTLHRATLHYRDAINVPDVPSPWRKKPVYFMRSCAIRYVKYARLQKPSSGLVYTNLYIRMIFSSTDKVIFLMRNKIFLAKRAHRESRPWCKGVFSAIKLRTARTELFKIIFGFLLYHIFAFANTLRVSFSSANFWMCKF